MKRQSNCHKFYLFFRTILCFIVISKSSLSIGSLPLSDEAFDAPKIVAVENKLFNPKYDLTVDVSFLPIDAFFKGIAPGMTFTYAFTPFLSWEVARLHYSQNQDTNLKNDLINNFNVRPQGVLDTIESTVSSNIVYTPIYSKNLLFNTSLIHGALSLVAGAGVVKFSSGETASKFGGGMYYRFFSSPRISYKLDGRVYGHLGKKKSSDVIMYISFGLSYEFGDNKPF